MDALEALLMPVPEDERMKALARSLRGRQVAADFFAGSTVPGLQRMAQGEQEYIKDVAERQGVLREAMERRKQDQSQHEDNVLLRQAIIGRDAAYQAAMVGMQGEANEIKRAAAEEKAQAAADKQAEKDAKKQAALNTNATRVMLTQDAATKAIDTLGTSTTGIPGAIMSRVAGSDRKALEGYIDVLKANLSFDRLQEMRDNSLTGGALGNVSNVELALLGSTVASLNPDQPREVLEQNLRKVSEMVGVFLNDQAGVVPSSVTDQPEAPVSPVNDDPLGLFND